MNRLFWGLFFVTLDVKLNIGSATFGLLPDFVGYFLLMKGMEQLAEESMYFERGRHWAFGMMLLHVILYGADLMDLSAGAVVGFWALGLLAFCVGMYVLHQMVAGIGQMEATHSWDLQGDKLKGLLLVQVVMGLIAYLLNWVPLISVFGALAAGVTAICLLIAMYGTKKRYEERNNEHL